MIIDNPIAIIHGPKYKGGPGLLYGLGKTTEDAWTNAALVMFGGVPPNMKHTIAHLRKQGYVARRIEVHLDEEYSSKE